MREFDLARVDERFAVKTQLLDVCGFVQETPLVVGIGIHGVERWTPAERAACKIEQQGKQQFEYLPVSAQCGLRTIIFRTRAIPIRRSEAWAISTARVMPNGDSMAANRPVLPGSRPQAFFDTQNFAFDVDDILRGIGLR